MPHTRTHTAIQPRWKSKTYLGLAGLVSLLAQASYADDSPGFGSYFQNWFERVSKTQAEQPHWVTPLATVTPRLEQEVRYDQIWQTTPSGQTITSYGGGKGLELIPFEKVEIIIGIPAWQTRNRPTELDGWTDESLLLKYRILSANEDNGNYILTAFLGFSIPSGSDHISSGHVVTTPTIAYGKGWSDFDFQSTLGVAIPDNGGSPKSSGTPILSNTALQYRVAKYFWPEIEVNYSYWPNGKREGRTQIYLTPGLVLGRFPISGRVGFTVGVGYQMAVTEKPTNDHAFIFSGRIPF